MHFITFSRKLGTNGTDIARQVADQLGYKLFDTQAIAEAARSMGFLQSVEEIDEKAPSLFQRIFSHKPSVELDRLISVVYELARDGDAVFLGRGGHILLKAFGCALHVRVTASREKRIEHLEKKGYLPEAAAKAIDKSDHERGGFIRFAFGADWNAPELYDIVLNMDKLSVDLAVQTIVGMARSDVIKACSLDSLRSLGMMALASRAEAALTEAGLSYGTAGTAVSLSVEEPGRVRLSGWVDEAGSRARAEEVLKKVQGVESIDNQIRVAPADRHA